MEITSGILTAAEMDLELLALPAMLSAFGIGKVEAFFGFGCDAKMDELYKAVMLAPGAIAAWVDSEGARIGFKISRGDLYIETGDGRFRMHFCHDSDIHVEGADAKLINAVEKRWRENKFPGSIFSDEKWISFSEPQPGSIG